MQLRGRRERRHSHDGDKEDLTAKGAREGQGKGERRGRGGGEEGGEEGGEGRVVQGEGRGGERITSMGSPRGPKRESSSMAALMREEEKKRRT